MPPGLHYPYAGQLVRGCIKSFYEYPCGNATAQVGITGGREELEDQPDGLWGYCLRAQAITAKRVQQIAIHSWFLLVQGMLLAGSRYTQIPLLHTKLKPRSQSIGE